MLVSRTGEETDILAWQKAVTLSADETLKIPSPGKEMKEHKLKAWQIDALFCDLKAKPRSARSHSELSMIASDIAANQAAIKEYCERKRRSDKPHLAHEFERLAEEFGEPASGYHFNRATGSVTHYWRSFAYRNRHSLTVITSNGVVRWGLRVAMLLALVLLGYTAHQGYKYGHRLLYGFFVNRIEENIDQIE